MSESQGLPPETGIGRVALRVGDLERQIEFYEAVVGLAVLERDHDVAVMGAGGTPLLRLEARPDQPPRSPDETGLYHTAFLYPDRAGLGDALARVEATTTLTGASDHLVSEALYLEDPAGNGIELYRDKPTAVWPVTDDGGIQMETLPLELEPIREAAAGQDRAPDGTAVGHLHLEVSDLCSARNFYVDALGLDLKQARGQEVAFMAAGEYHHHVGANAWNGRTAPATGHGLDWFEVAAPAGSVAAARDRLTTAGYAPVDVDGGIAVEDPDGIEVRVSFHDSR